MLKFSVGTASLLLINDIQLSSNELQEGAKPRNLIKRCQRGEKKTKSGVLEARKEEVVNC